MKSVPTDEQSGISLENSLPIPFDSSLLLEPGEEVKFESKAIRVVNDEFVVGQFILTNKRYCFEGDQDFRSQWLAEVSQVKTDYDYLVGLVSLGDPSIASGSLHLLKISAKGNAIVDSFGFIPDDEETTRTIGQAIIKLSKDSRSREHNQNNPDVPTRTVVIRREIVKVPCKYCGTLNEIATAKTCSNCGAAL